MEVCCPIVQFNIHVPTILGDFPIDRFVQNKSANLDSNNISRGHNNPQHFPHTPSVDKWLEQHQRACKYAINTYTEVRPQEKLINGRRGSWHTRQNTVYQHQRTTTSAD
jgi:hypothetical protein